MFNERKYTNVTLSAMGQGINKVATIAEIVKHRVKGLHQLNQIKTMTFEDLFDTEHNKEQND